MRTYKRPPTDPLFLSRSRAEWELEVFEEMLQNRDRIEAELEASSKDNNVPVAHRTQLIEQANAIADIFGEGQLTFDPLADQWEKDLEEGRVPDFDAPRKPVNG